MNLLLVRRHQVDNNGRVCIKGRQADHLIQILKVQEGSIIRAGILNTYVGNACVEHISDDSSTPKLKRCQISIQFMHSLHGCEPMKSPRFMNDHSPISYDILVGLPRPKFFDRVVHAAAMLGVRRIIFVALERSELAYFSSSKLSKQSIEDSIILGLEQAAYDIRPPEVYLYASWSKCLEALIYRFKYSDSKTLKLVLEKDQSSKPVDAMPLDGETKNLLLAFGAERGFLPQELIDLQQLGFSMYHLGPRVLQVQVAIITALAQVRLAMGVKEHLEAFDEGQTCWCQIPSAENITVHLPIRGKKPA